MQYRTLGRTQLEVSVIGMGTAQLRMVPEKQAIETLIKGFDRGINVVHVAPDYEGSEYIVAKAISETSKSIIVCGQGYDRQFHSDQPVSHFEMLFERLCRSLDLPRLDMFGIACIDDRERFGENIWGNGGMIDFLQRKKLENRLGSIFCTTHGSPEYIKALIEKDIFDAIMIPYNLLGFHLLSTPPYGNKNHEDLVRNGTEIIPLSHKHNIGLIIMKALAGGLMCSSPVGSPSSIHSVPMENPKAIDILRLTISDPAIHSAVVGVKSPSEADELARAGDAARQPDETASKNRGFHIEKLKAVLCSRCGDCDTKCAKSLPLSWMIRAGYVALCSDSTYETWEDIEYFRLYASPDIPCHACSDKKCTCPAGIDIPILLTEIHKKMMDMAVKGNIQPGLSERSLPCGDAHFAARLIYHHIPDAISSGSHEFSRIFLENTGQRGWFKKENPYQAHVRLGVYINGKKTDQAPIREDTHHGERIHFSFNVCAPNRPGPFQLTLKLLGEHLGFEDNLGLLLLEKTLVSQKNKPDSINDISIMNCPIRISSHNLPERLAAESRWFIWVCIENTSAAHWPEGAGFEIRVLINGNHQLSFGLPRGSFHSYEKKHYYFCFIAPASPASHSVSLKLYARSDADGQKHEVDECRKTIRIVEKETCHTHTHLATALNCNSWFYYPSQGMIKGGTSNSYPVFIKKAKRGRFTDSSGRQYIDYVMGWGSSLLGHAHPVICKAVSKTVKNGSMLSLPHLLEMELTRMLCDRFAAAEAVLFGKNGSDVTTAAIRLARSFTGKKHILFCGYHGWQDGFAESLGFAHTGVPERDISLVHPFKYGDIEYLNHLIKQYADQIAAIMIEPAGVIESIQGPIHDADRLFLEKLTKIAGQSGTLVIFDEIMTGFRYLKGSVHEYCGLRPDLVCLGKGLSAGMPLSALIGRAEIFHQGMARISYHPTFKGEACSLAAAKAALSVYEKKNISGHIWKYGQQLAGGIEELFDQYKIPASVIGPPFRMGISFHVDDPNTQTLLRTLLHQELIKNGIFTFNTIMLPCYAHNKSDLKQTLKAFNKSLRIVQQAMEKRNFAELLEIPEAASHNEPMCLTPVRPE
jgi:glutamate-1-semialdehyde aminotransferase/predicted aldo/keto reductase-like oxidoreductase